MKKNLIVLMTTISILASGAAVLADEIPAATIEPTADEIMNVPAQPDTPFEDRIQGDVMLISGDTPVDAPVSMPSYVSKIVTVTEIRDKDNVISTTINEEDKENPENTINYTFTDNTIVLGYANGDVKALKDIKVGDKITVFSNAYSPAPLILPPQYSADVIVVEDETEKLNNVNVDTYVKDETGKLVNLANTLALNIADDTEIVDREGKKVDANDLDRKDLVVVYNIETRSIPAQTNPVKVIVLGENEMAINNMEAAKNEADVTPAPTEAPEATEAPSDDKKVNFNDVKSIKIGDKSIENVYTKSENVLMVPLREIAESLGFTVEWDGELKAIMLNSGIYSLKVGENSYVKGRMMPQELSVAPEIKSDDLTYVPFEYFTEIIEAKANIEVDEEGAAHGTIELTFSDTDNK